MTRWRMDNFLRLRRIQRQHDRLMARYRVEAWWSI